MGWLRNASKRPRIGPDKKGPSLPRAARRSKHASMLKKNGRRMETNRTKKKKNGKKKRFFRVVKLG